MRDFSWRFSAAAMTTIVGPSRRRRAFPTSLDDVRGGALGGVASARWARDPRHRDIDPQRRLVCVYRFSDDMDAVLKLLDKYADVPMSFADACLVRMTETLNDPRRC